MYFRRITVCVWESVKEFYVFFSFICSGHNRRICRIINDNDDDIDEFVDVGAEMKISSDSILRITMKLR